MTIATPRVLFSEFIQIGFQVGIIKDVAAFPAARNPSYKVVVDFGGKMMTTIAQLPPNYPDISALFGKIIIGITNFPERKIAGFKSQFLIVGFPDAHGHVQLLNTRDKTFEAGAYLYASKEAKEMINYDQFKKAAIHVATVISVNALSESSYELSLDVGPLGIRQTVLVDVSNEEAQALLGTQVAVILNLQKEGIHSVDSMLLTVQNAEGKLSPLGVDASKEGQAPLGGELF
jgi:tRNA-binding protein